MLPGFGVVGIERDDAGIGIGGLIAVVHLLIDGGQHIIASAAIEVERQHLIGGRESIVVAAHIQVQAGKLRIARGIGGIIIDAALLVHHAAQLIVDTLAHIAQIIGGPCILRIKDKRLAIRLTGILEEILSAIGITHAQADLVVVGGQVL